MPRLMGIDVPGKNVGVLPGGAGLSLAPPPLSTPRHSGNAMATEHSRTAARLMVSPAVILLFLWMIVPLGMTIYFSFLRYNLLMPGMES